MAGELTNWTPGTPNTTYPTKVNSYKGLLHFVDNVGQTASLQVIADGLGNNTGIKISDTQISFDKAFIMSSLTASKLVYLNASNILTTIADGTVGQALVTDGAGGYSFASVSGSSPLTTKGDLYTFSTVNTRLPIGTDTYVLTADSTQATGMKWAAPAGGGITIGTTTITGGATTQLLFNLAGVVSSSAGLTYSSGLFTVLGTTQQAKFAYDASNHLGITIASNGSATFALTGTTPVNIFNQAIGIGATPASLFQVNKDVNSVTQSDANGISLVNATAATVGLQSISPPLVFSGNGWKTTATAASQNVKFRVDMLPVQSTTNPKSMLQFATSINGGAYANIFTLDSAAEGNLIGSGNATFNVKCGAGGSSVIQGYVNGSDYAKLNWDSTGLIFQNGAAARAALPFKFRNGSSVAMLTLNMTADATQNGFTLTSTNGGDATIEASGSDTNINLDLKAKGTGSIKFVYDASNHADFTVGATGSLTIGLTGTAPRTTFSQGVTFGGTYRGAGYTVATLPSGVVGDSAHVTDATLPTYLGALTGGGGVTCPVFYNGSAWVSA